MCGFCDCLGNRSGQLGRNLMFHHFTQAAAVFSDKVHAWRGPSTTVTIDDFVGPDKGPAAKAAGLPYLKGGICEVGGTLPLLAEAKAYSALPHGWGRQHKDMMRAGLVRDHIAGISMIGEDMPQLANRVDLDPSIRDVYGFPVPRITYSPHRFEHSPIRRVRSTRPRSAPSVAPASAWPSRPGGRSIATGPRIHSGSDA